MARFIFVFLGISLLGWSGDSTHGATDCERAGQTGCKPCFRPTSDPNDRIENKFPDVTELELERTELRLPLPQGSPPKYPDHSQELAIRIKTAAKDPEGDVLTYNYTVSGGRLVGTGANVTWDLNGVWPGTYTITAGVDDGCGISGAKVTKTVTILENESAPACVCPEIRIDALYLKRPSPDPIFSAYISSPKPPQAKYAWTLSEGSIISGQGTVSIKVRAPEEPSGQPVTVAVDISGFGPNCECATKATKTFRY